MNFIVILVQNELKLIKENNLSKSTERIRDKINVQDNFKFVVAYSYRSVSYTYSLI